MDIKEEQRLQDMLINENELLFVEKDPKSVFSPMRSIDQWNTQKFVKFSIFVFFK